MVENYRAFSYQPTKIHTAVHLHLHPGLDTSQLHSLLSALERDDLILDDVPVNLGVVFDHPEHHVVLGPGDPPDAPVIQIEEMIEIHVGLVEHDDFACGDVRADLAGALAVVLPGGIDNGERGQETVQIEPQVQLGSGGEDVEVGVKEEVEETGSEIAAAEEVADGGENVGA